MSGTGHHRCCCPEVEPPPPPVDCTECAGDTPDEIDVTFTSWSWTGCKNLNGFLPFTCAEDETVSFGSFTHAGGTLNGTFRVAYVGQSGGGDHECVYALSVSPSPLTFDVWKQNGCAIDPAACGTPTLEISLTVNFDALGFDAPEPQTRYRLTAFHQFPSHSLSVPADGLTVGLFDDEVVVAAAAEGADCMATVDGFVADGIFVDPEVALTGDAEVNPVEP